MQPRLVLLLAGARRLLSVYSRHGQQTHWIPLGFSSKRS